MAVLFLAQDSWPSFRKIGGSVFYYILLSKISLLIWSGSWSHAHTAGKVTCWMVEQEFCVGLLPPPLPSHQRPFTVGTCHMDCQNTEVHIVRKEPLRPAMGFFCMAGFGGVRVACIAWLSDGAGATQFLYWFGWSQRPLGAQPPMRELNCIHYFSSWVTNAFDHLIPRFSLSSSPTTVFRISCITGYLWGSEE